METNNILTRKDFIKQSSLVVAGIVASQSPLRAAGTVMEKSSTSPYRIKNVRLETGFIYENDEVIATKTDLFTLTIANGKISAISSNEPEAHAHDAKGALALPAFHDMHIHLDKTFYGAAWQAVRQRKGGVKGMIALEQDILPEMLQSTSERAGKLVELLQAHGSSYARSHVNIEPTSKLDSLKNLHRALEQKKQGFHAELVAFPQHGLFYTDTRPWMKEAAAMDIDFIGGLDPYSIDGSIERSIDFTVQLALDHAKGIDIHLHESGDSGRKTIEYLIKKVLENPVLQGKTYVSHAFVLAHLDEAPLAHIAESLTEAKIGIASTIPFGRTIMPLPTLYQYGVEVLTGNDSIIDHWNTFGSGSVLQKANLMAQLYGYVTEHALSRSLKLATRNILPLDDNGQQQWPKVGHAADMVLLNASCSAEAVSRIAPVTGLLHQGNIVF